MSNLTEPAKTTVVHIVGTMRDGGAEALLRTLVPRIAAEPDLDLHFVSIYGSRLDAAELEALGVPVHEIGRRSRADVSFAPRLVETIRRLKPQIAHTHCHSGKFAGRMAAIAAGVPNIVFSEHGDEAKGVVHWSVNRLLNARTAKFIVFTDGERERYSAEHGIPLERIKVIPNGILAPASIDVAQTRHQMGLGEDDFAIVIAARLVHQKNQELLLRSVAALHRAGRRNIRLFIIGEGPEAGTLQALARELEVADSVHFLGYRNDAQALTSASDLLALSSRWERMPLVMGEAMLSGVPVASTPWTGVETFIKDGETGYLSADWSIAAYSSTLARAMQDALSRKAVAARARTAAAERFDIRRAVRSHAELYRELVAAGSRTARTPGRLRSA